MHMTSTARFISAALIAVTAGPPGCERDTQPRPRATPAARDRTHTIPLPTADQRLCTGVVILIDTSGSMNQKVRGADGRRRPKHEIAREALEQIISYTSRWQKQHPDRVLQLGLIRFSSSVETVLPIEVFDEARAREALSSIPGPAAGTAIGQGLIAAHQSLYQSGCVRKHVLCITDGENTVGPKPDRVARQLFTQTAGEVETHFVAFDLSAESFEFVNEVNGHVVEADGQQLGTSLSEIYEKNILAEAMPAERMER